MKTAYCVLAMVSAGFAIAYLSLYLFHPLDFKLAIFGLINVGLMRVFSTIAGSLE